MSHPADHVSVSGRSEPRPSGPPVTHDIRFYAECAPCQWRVRLDEHHTDEDYARLRAMHEGGEPA